VADDNSNGRVRDAVLEERLQHIQVAVDELRQEFKYLSTQIVQISNNNLTRMTALETWRDGHKEEHVRENRLVMIASGIGSLIASILGITVKVP